MASKENICFKILNKYGLMIDGPEERVSSVKNLPDVSSELTFKKWKESVFGDSSVCIEVYTLSEPAAQTKINTLKVSSGSNHIKNVFSKFKKHKDKKLEVAKKETEEHVINKLSTFPKETLKLLLEESDVDLQESVKEFFSRYTESTDEKIDTEKLLRDLIRTYNESVSLFRKKNV